MFKRLATKTYSSIKEVLIGLRVPLLANSLYLLAGRFGSTIFVFVFWALVARRIAPDQVGLAISANSAVVVIVLLADLGLSSSIVRYSFLHPDTSLDIVNTSIATGWIASILGGLIFLAGIPIWSPELAILRQNPIYAAGFVASIVAINLLNLQGSALLARRRGDFIFWRYNLSSIFAIIVFLLVDGDWGGFSSVFYAYNLPNWIILVLASLVILPSFYSGYRAFGRFKVRIAILLTRFAGANHIATILWEMPAFLLPLMAANLISPEAAAFFYMPWIIGLTVLAIPQLVSTSLFVEASRSTDEFNSLVKKAGKMILVMALPAVTMLWIWGDQILHLLGEEYVNVQLLHLILLSVFPYAVNAILFAYFRVTLQIHRLILLSLTSAAGIFGIALILSDPMGEVGLALGWLLGQTITALFFSGFLALRFVNRRAT